MASYNKQLLVTKIETTEGVDSAPTGTANAVQVIDLKIKDDSDDKEREIAVPYWGAKPFILTARQRTFEFDVEIAGSGFAGTPPAWGPFLQACGFSQTVVPGTSVSYRPVSSAVPSLTTKMNHDGIEYVALGCRGDAEWSFKEGDRGVWSFTMQGAFVDPTDVPMPVATYLNQAVPVYFNSDNVPDPRIDGRVYCVSEFKGKLNNDLSYKERAGCAKRTSLTGRSVEGEITFERLATLADGNLYTKIGSHTQIPILIPYGTTAGNIVTFSLPTNQFMYPELDEDDNIIMENYSFKAIPTSATVPEMVITCT